MQKNVTKWIFLDFTQAWLALWAQFFEQNSRPPTSKALASVINIPQLSHLIM